MQLAKHDVEVRLASSAHIYISAKRRPERSRSSHRLGCSSALTPSRPHTNNHSTNLFKKVLTQGCTCPNQYNELQISTIICVWGWEHRRSAWRRGGRVLLHTSKHLVHQNKKQKKIKKNKKRREMKEEKEEKEEYRMQP